MIGGAESGVIGEFIICINAKNNIISNVIYTINGLDARCWELYSCE